METVIVVLANDYLDVRHPAWAACERAGAVQTDGPFVLVRPTMTPVIEALWRTFPSIYIPPTVAAMITALNGEVVAVRSRTRA